VSFFPRSPRRRRRLGWTAGAGLAVAAAVAATALLPGGRDGGPVAPARAASAGKPEPPPPAPGREVELTASTRREINAALARFIPAAVRRDDPALAWTLAGPKLRTGWTRRDWLNDAIPVFPYPAKATGFEGWRKIYSYDRRVGLDLVMQPRKKGIGALAVGVEMVRLPDGWRVNEWVPVAAFTPVDERQWVTGIADFNAGGWTDKGLKQKPMRARLGGEWLLVPLALLGIGFLAPLAFVARAARRNRRARVSFEASLADGRVTWRSP
jgi:hypothetical protein